jgi:hypothetical protein
VAAPPVQAEKALGLQPWREAFGTGYGSVETRSHPAAATKGHLLAFSKPSNGLEPFTPSLPSSNEAGSEGKSGKPRARKPRNKKESAEDA